MRGILERIPAVGGDVEMEESGEEWAELGIEWVLVGDDENESRLMFPFRRFDNPVAPDLKTAPLVPLVVMVGLKGGREVGVPGGIVALARSL